MTFSIAACDSRRNSWGVAVATRYLAVGAMVPAAELGAGALATQALTNLSYRQDGLTLLRGGSSAEHVVSALVDADEDADFRQLGIVDREGGSFAWTGAHCLPFAGSHTGPGFAIQGNLLAGSQVLTEMRRAWLHTDTATPLPDRLLAVLAAGDAAGGDLRGRQSAALYVVGPQWRIGHGTDVHVDLRVDDATDPVSELSRLLKLRNELAEAE